MLLAKLSGPAIALIVVLAVLVILAVLLYFVGKKTQKAQAENEKAMAAAAQEMKLFIIDKKKAKMKDANLPKAIMDQVPKMARMSKMPMVKAKVGPKIITFICDTKVCETILPKQEVMATVSGIYISKARRLKGPVYKKEEKIMQEKMMLVETFGKVAIGEPLVFSSETRCVMMAINQGNATRVYGLDFGSAWKMVIRKVNV